jgi:hypothetical protein
MKKIILINMIVFVSALMLANEVDCVKNRKIELIKYEKIYVIKTPENPFKKTPVIKISSADVLPKIKNMHPRMFITNDKIQELKKQYSSDIMLQKYVKDILVEADKIERSTEEKDEKKFLSDMLVLGFAYHWTNDNRFAIKATNFMLESATRSYWGMDFLPIADAALTVGIGYDIFYNYFDADTRNTIRVGIIKNGLYPGIAAYDGAPFGWFKDVRHNWNIVCNSSMIISSLAIAEDDVTFNYFAGKMVPEAVKSLAKAFNEYALDGAYPEGTGYWGYATSVGILGLEAMQNALNTDFGLSKFEGFDKTYYFRWHLTAPNGIGATFADCTPGWPVRPEGIALWLGKRFNDPRLINYEHTLLAQSKRKATIYHLMYYQPTTQTVFEPLPTDAYFKGPVEVATMRTEWDNPNAVYVNIKAGYNQVNHGHLDLGRFEYYALGECWFTELGKEEYGLPDYFDMNGKRWTYFRAGALSHNVPIIDEKNQNMYATTHFSNVAINQPISSVKIDLSDAYKNQSKSMSRELSMDKSSKNVTITDSYDLLQNSIVSWRGITEAKIQISGNKAVLEQKGKKIQVKILSPKNGKFIVESAEQKPPLKENKGFSILKVVSSAKAGVAVLKVEISTIN